MPSGTRYKVVGKRPEYRGIRNPQWYSGPFGQGRQRRSPRTLRSVAKWNVSLRFAEQSYTDYTDSEDENPQTLTSQGLAISAFGTDRHASAQADKSSSFAIVGWFYHHGATVVKFTKRIISALLFLTASERRLETSDPRRFTRLVGAMMLMSIAVGVVLAGLWGLTSHLTCVLWPSMLNYWVVSSLVCGSAIVFGPYRRSAEAVIESVGVRSRPSRRIGLVLLAAGVAVILHYAFRQFNSGWLWPRPLCRVLLLSPVWGAWSMVVLVQFHRPDGRTDPPTRCFTETVSPISSAVCLAIPLAGSLIFLNFLYPWRHFIPPASAVATALVAGTLIVRRRGEMSRKTLLATNFLTQLGFLTAYMVVR